MTAKALICPLGGTGPVVTETINAMIEKELLKGEPSPAEPQIQWPSTINSNDSEQFKLDIFVLFTTGGAYDYSILPENMDKIRDSHLPKYFKEQVMPHKVVSAGNIHILNKYKFMTQYVEYTEKNNEKSYKPNLDSYSIFPNIRLIAIPIQKWSGGKLGDALKDIRNNDHNVFFQLIMYGLHHCLLKKYPQVYISLAGGRKTMSAYGMVSAMLFGNETENESVEHIPPLSHILVKKRSNEKFEIYQLPRGAYDFQSVPYFPLAELARTLLDEMDVKVPDTFELEGKKVQAEEIIKNSDIFDLLLSDEFRSFIYQVGEKYEENINEITRNAGRLIKQGIAFRAVKHELLDKLKRKEGEHTFIRPLHGAIDTIARMFNRKTSIKEESIDIEKVVLEAFDDLKEMNPRLKDRTFLSSIEGKAIVTGDKTLVRQMFFNLIKNSYEAFLINRTREEKKKMQCEISLEIFDENSTKIIYKDNSGGIPPNHAKNIFQFGYSTKGSGSRGVGMYICRRVMEIHGGKIEYHDRTDFPQGGAVFIITFLKEKS